MNAGRIAGAKGHVQCVILTLNSLVRQHETDLADALRDFDLVRQMRATQQLGDAKDALADAQKALELLGG